MIKNSLKHLLITILLTLPACGQSIFSCQGSSSQWVNAGGTGPGGNVCSVAPVGQPYSNWALAGSTNSSIAAGQILMFPSSDGHDANSLIYETPVSVNAWTTTFSFIPSGQQFAIALENNNNSAVPSGSMHMIGGAGGEGDVFQGCCTNTNAQPSPNNIWALKFDSESPTTYGGSVFSNVQMTQIEEAPYIPVTSGGIYQTAWNKNQVNTSPVLLTTSLSGQGTSTGHTYSATVTYTGTNIFLTMYDVTASGTCTPVTSGSCFSYNWPLVNLAGIVNGTTAYFGLMNATGSTPANNQYVVGASFTHLSAASAPTYSVAGGSYGSTQSVTLSSTSSGAVICYNTTGSPATNSAGGCQPNSTLYSGAISVSGSETLYAVAGGTGFGDSTISNAAYVINSTPAQVKFNPAYQSYFQGTQYVYLTTNSGTSIYYNTTGSPTCSSTLYSGPITVSSNETIYAVSCISGTASAVDSVAYVISPWSTGANNTPYPSNSPQLSLAPGTYSGTQSVTLTNSTSGATSCYLLSATPPAQFPQPDMFGNCQIGTLYSSAISIPSSTTLYAISGTNLAGAPSSMVVAPYTITGATAATPTFSPAAGSYAATQAVTISDSTSGASIYYCTTGPCTSGGTLVTGTVSVASSEALYAYATASGYTQSSTASASYTITGAATPTFSPAAGSYSGTQTVTISTTAGGVICYNITGSPATNGSNGCATGTVYSGPVTVSTTETLYAVAGGTGYTDSSVGSSAYTITGGPTAYYMSPTGSDSNNGLTAGTAWATPNHALNCGDTITAAAGAYTVNSFAFGTVTCAANNNVAWLQCATPFACTGNVTTGGQYAQGIGVGASYWGVQGWVISTASGEGQCFDAAPPTSSASIHHIIFANNIANGCGKAGFEIFNNGAASVDYVAFLGNIAYGAAAGSTECESGFNIFSPVATDSAAGTHYYFAGNFSYDNVDPGTCAGNTPGTDGEGLFFDTVQPYGQQLVMDNNIAVFNGGNGIKVYNNTTGTPAATVYFRHNTTYGNETGGVNGGICSEIGIQSSYNSQAFANLAVTTASTACSGSQTYYAYATAAANATDAVFSNYGYSAAGNNVSASGATVGTNTFSNPTLSNPVNPSAPSCSTYATTTACMASVIANFRPTVIAAQAYGYQQPSTTSVFDSLYPHWLCTANVPAGLVTPGCLAPPQAGGAMSTNTTIQ